MKLTLKPICASIVTSASVLSFASIAQAATNIFFEDFEDSTVTYTSNFPDDLSDIASRDYFGRIDAGSGLPADVMYSNMQGSGFFGVQDTDGTIGNPTDTVQLDWTGIDISGFTDLGLSWYVAEDTAADLNEDWDITTSVQLQVQIDGGGYFNVFAIESISSFGGNVAPAVDTNFDGLGDGALITDTFTQFSSSIANGSTLDIRFITTDLDTGDEDIAFDNLLLVGEAVPEPSSLALLGIGFIGLLKRRVRH